MTVYFISDFSALSKFVKCLRSLPNLHTLEIVQEDGYITPSLKNPLRLKFKGVKLPQIKTLILPPVAHPLLKHCPNVEDVNWVVGDRTISSDQFLRSLASIQDSKIKRLAIPLILPGNPSRELSDTPLDHRVRTATDHPLRQDMWPRVQGSQNSLSSALTHTYSQMTSSSRKRESRSAQFGPHAPKQQSWSTYAKNCQISIHSRSYILPSAHLAQRGDWRGKEPGACLS